MNLLKLYWLLVAQFGRSVSVLGYWGRTGWVISDGTPAACFGDVVNVMAVEVPPAPAPGEVSAICTDDGWVQSVCAPVMVHGWLWSGVLGGVVPGMLMPESGAAIITPRGWEVVAEHDDLAWRLISMGNADRSAWGLEFAQAYDRVIGDQGAVSMSDKVAEEA